MMNKSNVVIEDGLPALYRCIDVADGSGVYIAYVEYWAYKKTKQGYWVVPAEYKNRQYLLSFSDVLNRNKKYVSTSACLPWCHLTKEKALMHFMKKKQAQIKYLQLKLATIKQIIECETPEDRDGRLFCGQPEEFLNWAWE